MRMTNETKQLMARAESAKTQYKMGAITREQAITSVTPYIDLVNKRSKELAKEYEVPFRKVSVTGYLR